MEEKPSFNIKYLIIGVLCTLQTVGVYEQLVNIEPNNCIMTYMYETPQYIPIKLPADFSSNFSRFSLHVYGEGAQASAYKNSKFDGQPVLYIPGSAGSHKQVRSLASVAYRKSLDDDSNVHFDFFTADFSEDLGAVFGPALQEQTDFIAAVLPVIQKLYLTAKPIILIGHSMGGLVARGVLAAGVPSTTVPLIVTLASPHLYPLLRLDHSLQAYYDKVNVFWALERSEGGAVADVAVVSVSGGRNDMLVPTLAAASPFSHVTSVTTAVPGCWTTTDHLSIVWCKQLVLALVRSLFDVFDTRSNSLHSSKTRLTSVFDYHLLSRHSGKRFVSQRHRRQLKFLPSQKWVVKTERQLEHTFPANAPHVYLLIPAVGSPQNKYHTAVIRVRGLDEKEWVFACAASHESGTPSCSSGMNLSKRGRLLGGTNDASLGKMVEVLLPALVHEGYSHIGVSVPPSEHPVTVSVDIYGEKERRTAVATPRLVSSFKPTVVVQTTTARSLVHNIVLEGLNEPWHSYDLSVMPSTSCAVNTSNGSPHPQLWVSGYTSSANAIAPHRIVGNEYVYRLEQDEIAILPSADGNSGTPERGDLTVQLLLEHSCLYSISVRASLQGTFSRLFLLYGSQVPAFVVCHLLLALAMQLKSVGDQRHCPPVLASILALTPMLVVPFVKLSAMALKKLEIYNDQQMLTDSGMDLGVLPIFLFLTWMPVTLLLSGGVWVGVLVAGNALYSSVVRVFGASLGAGEIVADLALTGLSKVPAIVAVALLAVAYSTCGALALSLASLYYFVTLFDMYKDYLRKVILKMIPRLQDETPPQPPAAPAAAAATSATSSETNDTAKNPPAEESSTAPTPTSSSDEVVITRKVVPQSSESLALHLHLTLLLLCILASLLQLPTLITWAVRVKNGHSLLPEDPSLYPSITSIAALAVLWQCSPVHERKYYKLVGQVVHFLAVISLLFASMSLYRLPYVVAVALALVALHQLLAPAAPQHKEKTN
ncbi:GPI inositol-deacylase PGAP1-like [Trinorchestia longiramus]|nr:GPI inositol-deacylase PGAP1-like [Trinorchestia longiramus]